MYFKRLIQPEQKTLQDTRPEKYIGIIKKKYYLIYIYK